MEVNFELDKQVFTIEELEAQQNEILENAKRVQAEAEAQSKEIAKAILKAKKKKRADELQNITDIVLGLKAQYGDDFMEVIQKHIPPRVIKVSEEEKDQHERYLRVLAKGYYVKEDKAYNHLHTQISSSITVDNDTPHKFVMNVKTFINCHIKFS